MARAHLRAPRASALLRLTSSAVKSMRRPNSFASSDSQALSNWDTVMGACARWEARSSLLTVQLRARPYARASGGAAQLRRAP